MQNFPEGIGFLLAAGSRIKCLTFSFAGLAWTALA
jgi:hypothetical protein